MPETWVVRIEEPDVVDLKTVALTGNVIEVRNVFIQNEDPHVARVAGKFVNSGTQAADRALLVEGRAEIVRTANDEIALIVRNPVFQDAALALFVDGKSKFTGKTSMPHLIKVRGKV